MAVPGRKPMDDAQDNMQRSCGSCSLCCKLLAIEGVEERPGFTWCRHCRPGKGGCGIYDHRPEACRNFVCGWLSGALDGVLDPERWHPAKARMMMTAEAVDQQTHIVVHVDPSFPERWRQTPYREDIRRLADWYREGRLKLRELVARTYGLAAINEALMAL